MSPLAGSTGICTGPCSGSFARTVDDDVDEVVARLASTGVGAQAAVAVSALGVLDHDGEVVGDAGRHDRAVSEIAVGAIERQRRGVAGAGNAEREGDGGDFVEPLSSLRIIWSLC